MTRTHITLDDGGWLANADDKGPEPHFDAVDAVAIDGPGDAASVVDEDGAVAGGLPKRAVRHGDGSITLPLRYPASVTVRSSSGVTRDEHFKHLTFHRLNGAALRAIQAASDDTRTVVTLAKSCRINDAIMNRLFDKMDAADIKDAGEIVSHFLD